MDLLYRRYANPFIFLQKALEMGQLFKGLAKVIELEDEDRLWELYLHSYPNTSFEKWKENVKTSAKPKGLTSDEVTTQVNEAQNILNSFHL